MIGVHSEGGWLYPLSLDYDFVRNVPPNAEVVVNYRVEGNNRLHSGTALIPKTIHGTGTGYA